MDTYFAVFLILFTQFFHGGETCSNDLDGFDKVYPGLYYSGGRNPQGTAKSLDACAQNCLADDKCWGFMFIGTYCATYRDGHPTQPTSHAKAVMYQKCEASTYCGTYTCPESKVWIWEYADTPCDGECSPETCCEDETPLVCNENFVMPIKDISCEDFKTYMYCYYDGSKGISWHSGWGDIDSRDYYNENRENYLNCPQCGCGFETREIPKYTECDLSWADNSGNNCQGMLDKGYCTETGDFGPNWWPIWGWFDESRNLDANDNPAYVCPQCGCEDTSFCAEGTWATDGRTNCQDCKICDEISQEIEAECIINDNTKCRDRDLCEAGKTWSNTGYASCKNCDKCEEHGMMIDVLCSATIDSTCKVDPNPDVCEDSSTCLSDKFNYATTCGHYVDSCDTSVEVASCCPAMCGICEGTKFNNKGMHCQNYCDYSTELAGRGICAFCGDDRDVPMNCCSKDSLEYDDNATDACKNAIYTGTDTRNYICVSSKIPVCADYTCSDGTVSIDANIDNDCQDSHCDDEQCCEPIDRNGNPCGTNCNGGGYNGYGGPCAWCGIHDDKPQSCCHPWITYPEQSDCHIVEKAEGVDESHCVVKITEDDLPDRWGQNCHPQCVDNGFDVCQYCGKHNDNWQYCCAALPYYSFPEGHNCYEAAQKDKWIYGESGSYHCVTKNPEDIIAWSYTLQMGTYVDSSYTPEYSHSCSALHESATDINVCKSFAEAKCVEYNCMYMTISEDLNTAYFMNLISNKRISDSNWRFYIASSNDPWDLVQGVDRHHKKCRVDCPDNGAKSCGWCGRHQGELQYCCGARYNTAEDHHCHSTDWIESLDKEENYCVIKKPFDEGHIVPPIPPPLVFTNDGKDDTTTEPEAEWPWDNHNEVCDQGKSCWNGWEECRFCGLHNELPMHCCRKEIDEYAENNPCRGGLNFDENLGDDVQQCVVIDFTKVQPTPDRNHEVCYCADNGETCDWCGQHNGKEQACCAHKKYYNDCKNAVFDPTNMETPHCVVLDENQPSCQDDDSWRDSNGSGCSWYAENPSTRCGWDKTKTESCSKCCACEFEALCNVPTMACERNRYLSIIDDSFYMEQQGWIIHMCMKELSTPGVGAYCNQAKGYWYGYDKNSLDLDAEGRIGFYTYGEGIVTIEYGNCGESGTANLYHNQKLLKVADFTERGDDVNYEKIVIEYKNLDFIEIRDKNGHAIPNIKSVSFQCTVSNDITYVYEEPSDVAELESDMVDKSVGLVNEGSTQFSHFLLMAFLCLGSGMAGYAISRFQYNKKMNGYEIL